MDNKKNFEEKITIVLFISLATLSVLQVLMRYIIGKSLGWSEEAMRYIYVWMCLLGVSSAIKNDNHIKISMIVDRLPEKGRKLLGIISDILFGFVSIIFVFYGINMLISYIEFPQKSPAMEIPLAVVYAALPVGFGLTIFRIIKKYVNTSKMVKE